MQEVLTPVCLLMLAEKPLRSCSRYQCVLISCSFCDWCCVCSTLLRVCLHVCIYL